MPTKPWDGLMPRKVYVVTESTVQEYDTDGNTPSETAKHLTFREQLGTNPVDWALFYASLGWAIFPCHAIVQIAITPEMAGACTCGNPACSNKAKHPLTSRGFKDATTNPDIIRAWWKQWPYANIAVATGEISGIVVIDVDAKEDDGYATLAKIEAAHDNLITLESATGGGGSHLIFRHPGTKVTNSNSWLKKRFGRGIDVRGDGGYIVLPPSQHATGAEYAWCDSEHSVIEIRELPTWFLEILAPPPATDPKERTVRPHTTTRTAPVQGGDKTRQMAAAMDAIIVKLATETEGNRNNLLFWSASRVREMLDEGGPEGWVADLYDAALAIGLDTAEVYKTLCSALTQPVVDRATGRRVA